MGASVLLPGTRSLPRYRRRLHQRRNYNSVPVRLVSPSAVLGLGKLGGQELNYSSDVDVIFVYSEEGCVFQEGARMPPSARTTPRAVLSNHQFFNRLAEARSEER